jgi:hypothetical protein
VTAHRGAPSLALGSSWLGQLTDDAVILWDAAKLTRGKRIPLKNPRGIGVLADGSLLAIGAPEPGSAKVVHINKSGTTKAYPATMRTATDALSRVLPHPSGQAFVVLPPGSEVTLDSYKLALLAGELELLDSRKLPFAAPRSVTAMPDKTLLFLDGTRLQPVDPSRSEALLPIALPAELSPAALIGPGTKGQVFVATEQSVSRVEITGGQARATASISTGGRTVYALDSAGDHCAVILVDQSKPVLAWSLVVYGAGGKELLSKELPFMPARTPAEPHTVRVGASGIVAVGNARHLWAWNVATGQQLLRDGADAGPRHP